jgi:hypothetical protein
MCKGYNWMFLLDQNEYHYFNYWNKAQFPTNSSIQFEFTIGCDPFLNILFCLQ